MPTTPHFDPYGVLTGTDGDDLARYVLDAVAHDIERRGWNQPHHLHWLLPPAYVEAHDPQPQPSDTLRVRYTLTHHRSYLDANDLVGTRAPAHAAGAVFTSEGWMRSRARRHEVRIVTWLTRTGHLHVHTVARHPEQLTSAEQRALDAVDPVTTGRIPAYIAATLSAPAQPCPLAVVLGATLLTRAEHSHRRGETYMDTLLREAHTLDADLHMRDAVTSAPWTPETVEGWTTRLLEGGWNHIAALPGRHQLLKEPILAWGGTAAASWDPPHAAAIGPGTLEHIYATHGTKTGRTVRNYLTRWNINPEHLFGDNQ